MRVLKSKEAIFNVLPPLTEEDMTEMNKRFTPYLFFEDHKKESMRECWCSSCRAHFGYDFYQRTETPEHYEFIRKKHNEWTVCPKCGAAVKAKNIRKVKSCANLDEWKRIVFVKPKGKNTVFLVCAYAHKSYTGMDFLTEPKCNICTVYYLTPQYVREFKNAYDYAYLGLRSGEFYEPKRITEPFTKTYCYNISRWEKRGYSLIGFSRLQNTFLRYHSIELFEKAYESYWYTAHYGAGECLDIKFLAYSALYPNIEKLLKLGLSDFVCSLIDGRPMKRYIDWNAQTPKQMFHMRADEFRDFRENYYGEEDFKVYQILKGTRKHFKYSEAAAIAKRFGKEASLRLAQAVKKHKLNLTRTLRYLDKKTPQKKSDTRKTSDFEHTAILWTDYLSFAERLKYDLNRDDVIFPKNLQKSHDDASKAVIVLKDAEAFEKYKKRYEKLERIYAFSDGEYSIVIPQGVNDIVEEGKVLGHCVGGYAERHVRGATTILFMRKCATPNKRYITIEVRDREKRICQNYGRKNRRLTQSEKAFVDKWIAWVQAGSQKAKKKKDAEAA